MDWLKTQLSFYSDINENFLKTDNIILKKLSIQLSINEVFKKLKINENTEYPQRLTKINDV